MYSTMVIWPIVSALWALVHFEGGDSTDRLCSINETQKAFIEKYASKKENLSRFVDKELRAWASTDIAYLNKILQGEGFSIQLSEDDADWGVVSILDVMIKWQHAGKKETMLAANKNNYSAVAMNKGFDLYSTLVHNHPVISIPTKNSDKVFITVVNESYESFELLSRIQEIRKAPIKEFSTPMSYDEIIFPMIDYNKEFNLSWLEGLKADSGAITQALQQTKFKMNENGAHVKSAVALGIRECALFTDKNSYTVDKPFLIWIERPGVEAPIFAGYMDYEHWKDPKTLDL